MDWIAAESLRCFLPHRSSGDNCRFNAATGCRLRWALHLLLPWIDVIINPPQGFPTISLPSVVKNSPRNRRQRKQYNIVVIEYYLCRIKCTEFFNLLCRRGVVVAEKPSCCSNGVASSSRRGDCCAGEGYRPSREVFLRENTGARSDLCAVSDLSRTFRTQRRHWFARSVLKFY